MSQTGANQRASEFNRRCKVLAIKGITLHSYRYAWAQRAKAAGYPERYAMEALGHNSQTVHRAYAGKGRVKLPSLEEYENCQAQGKIIPLELPRGGNGRSKSNKGSSRKN